MAIVLTRLDVETTKLSAVMTPDPLALDESRDAALRPGTYISWGVADFEDKITESDVRLTIDKDQKRIRMEKPKNQGKNQGKSKKSKDEVYYEFDPNKDRYGRDRDRIWDLFGEEWAVVFTDLSGFSRRATARASSPSVASTVSAPASSSTVVR